MLSEHVHFESLLLPVGMNMYYLCAGETKCSLKLRKKKCAYISIGRNELENIGDCDICRNPTLCTLIY